jgi:hypothetical protein
MLSDIANNLICVGRSAHGIHFWDRDRYVKYRQRCLELFGEDYYQLKNRIYEHWNPFRLQRATKHKS